MESLKSICRICLDYKVDIDWNNYIEDLGGISYKDCYYKYTQLEEPDEDYYPANLCDKCASELKKAHAFFEHALESFKTLQNAFNAKELAAENFILKNCYSQGIVHGSFDNSFIDEKDHYNIDEVICYSPVNEDVDTENELNEIICERNCASPSESQIEEQPIDSYIKILNSSSESNKSFETTLELNLQLEIQGTNLLKSSAKKNTAKCAQSLHKSSIKRRCKKDAKKSVHQQTVQCNVSIERVLDSTNQQLSNSEIESLCTDALNLIGEHPNNTFEQSLLEANAVESSTNVPLNEKLSKPKELHKLSIAKTSGRKRGSELAEYLLFMQNFNGCDINSLACSTASQKLSISKHNEKPSEQSVIPLSEESIGKDDDINYFRVCKPQRQKEIMCQYCSKVFISIYKAIEHEKTHLENRERKETCTKCGLKFYNKNALRSHMYTHKENREKNLKCEFCGKAFYNNNGLSIHRRIHIGPRIPCNICSKEYYRQSDLDKHMVSHSATRVDGDLKYRKKYFVYCEICGNEVRSVDYKSHIAKHNNEPLAKCAICDKEFFSRKSCISHLKSVHRKGSGERSNFAISYKTKYYSKLFLQQKTGTLFTKDKV